MEKTNVFETSKVGKYQFFAMPFHCDFSNHLRIDHLGNDMLNAADLHSDARGFGMNYLKTVDKTWVLSRFAIEVVDMPVSYKVLNVETWVESAMRFFTSRNFAVTGTDGEVYAYGRSIWAMIDTNTRQPVDLLKVRDGLLNDYVETDKPCPVDSCSRVKVNGSANLWSTVKATYCDIDINGHVNSVKYIEHVLDLWDIVWYKFHRIKRVEVAYVAEAHCGDELHFYVEERSENDFYIRVMTKNEVCRCYVKFEEIITK